MNIDEIIDSLIENIDVNYSISKKPANVMKETDGIIQSIPFQTVDDSKKNMC